VGTFWDWVAVAGRWAGYFLAFCVIAYILLITVVGVAHMAKLFTVDFYHHWKYTVRGFCPKCHRPAVQVVTPADQIFGQDKIGHLICACGAKSIPTGNRHAAEW
jgi:hypothetical protein